MKQILLSLSLSITVIITSCVTNEKVTPLMKAAKSGDTTEVEKLIAEKSDLNQESRFGWTALMFAAWQGHEQTVITLLHAGADPNVISDSVPSGFETVGGHPPSTALQESVRHGHLQVARHLIEAGATIQPEAIALAGKTGDVGFLKYLKTKGADFNTPTQNAFYASPLCAAASAGKLPAVRWLLANHAKPNLIASGQAALIEAVDNDHVEVVRYLLNHGANPNITVGSIEDTPLFSAVTKHTDSSKYAANLSIIKLLLAAGADKSHQSFNGQHTALEFKITQRLNAEKYFAVASPKTAQRLKASIAHHDQVIRLLQK